MPSRRFATLRSPVTISLDGEELLAEKGEPVAVALIAAGHLAWARSPKYHRPRGPSCLRAACDGCLARVNDSPNVMTCRVPATEGLRVVSQNRLGPRDRDLLRVTDWFFPNGMNHHELFAGVPGVQTVMQTFARRIAGLGTLPSNTAPREQPIRRAERRRVDVLVVGAGPSGMAIASKLALAGRAVEVIDDSLVPGGSVTALAPNDGAAFDEIVATFTDFVARGTIALRLQTVAGGLYNDGTSRSARCLLVVGPEGASVIEARAFVLACGAQDGALAFEGNDIPGVVSARAAGWLLARGVLIGEAPVVVEVASGGPFGASFARAYADCTGREVRVVRGEPRRARGVSRVSSLMMRDVRDGRDNSETAQNIGNTYAADAVILDAPRAPVYELAAQGGAQLRHEPSSGYVVVTDRGRVNPGLFALGEMTGTPLDARAIFAEADTVAQAIADDAPSTAAR